MYFKVLSRSNAKRICYKKMSSPRVIISITDPEEGLVSFAPNDKILAVLRLQFEDVIDDSLMSMKKTDAVKVVDFVNMWKDRVGCIVIHCEAGISRSAGVCSALMVWLNGNDMEIYNNHYYHPNRLCRSLILEELIERGLV